MCHITHIFLVFVKKTIRPQMPETANKTPMTIPTIAPAVSPPPPPPPTIEKLQ